MLTFLTVVLQRKIIFIFLNVDIENKLKYIGSIKESP